MIIFGCSSCILTIRFLCHTSSTLLFYYRASTVCRTWRDVIRGFDGIEKARVEDFVARKLEFCQKQGKVSGKHLCVLLYVMHSYDSV